MIINFINRDKTKSLEVESKHVALAVRGTKFFISHGRGGESDDLFVHVHEGEIAVLNQIDDDHEIVGAKHGMKIKKGRQLERPRKYEWTKKLHYKMNLNNLKHSQFHHPEIAKLRRLEVKRIVPKRRKRKSIKHLRLRDRKTLRYQEFKKDKNQQNNQKKKHMKKIKNFLNSNPPPLPPPNHGAGDGTNTAPPAGP